MNTCLSPAPSAFAAATVAKMRTFQVWLAEPPAFFSKVEHMASVHVSGYKHAGTIHVSGGDDDTTDLEVVYEKTQNIDRAWNASAPCRSVSVGDLVREISTADNTAEISFGRAWLVQSIGFVEVLVEARPLPSFDEALANGYVVHLGGPDDGPELRGKYWWTLCRGWPEAEVSRGEWFTESDAQRDACLALMKERDNEGTAVGKRGS